MHAPQAAATLAALATILTAVSLAGAAPADRIIRGGPIVTVNPDRPAAEAVAIADGRIVAVGSGPVEVRGVFIRERLSETGGHVIPAASLHLDPQSAIVALERDTRGATGREHGPVDR